MVWGFLGFLGLGSLYKHKRITMGKNGAYGTVLHEISECPCA